MITVVSALSLLSMRGPKQAPQGARPASISIPEIMRSLDFYETSLKSSEPWKQIGGKYVDLRYLDASSAHASRDSAIMDRAVAYDCGVMKLPLPEKQIPVYLFPNNESLNHALGFPVGTQSGISLGVWAVIVAGPKVSSSEVGDSAAHELGHALMHKDVGLFGCPVLAEGIAYYLQARFENSAWVAKPVPLESTPMSSLVSVPGTNKDFVHGAHFCAYLLKLDKNDPTRIKAVFKAVHEARMDDIRKIGRQAWSDRVDGAFKKVYGVGLNKLDADWHRMH